MTDFLLRDWVPTPFTYAPHIPSEGMHVAGGWIRVDAVRLEFTERDGRRFVDCFIDEAPRASAEIRVREKDGATILVPPPSSEVAQRDAVAFWPRFPSIHLAALALVERTLWPTPREHHHDPSVHV